MSPPEWSSWRFHSERNCESRTCSMLLTARCTGEERGVPLREGGQVQEDPGELGHQVRWYVPQLQDLPYE